MRRKEGSRGVPGGGKVQVLTQRGSQPETPGPLWAVPSCEGAVAHPAQQAGKVTPNSSVHSGETARKPAHAGFFFSRETQARLWVKVSLVSCQHPRLSGGQSDFVNGLRQRQLCEPLLVSWEPHPLLSAPPPSALGGHFLGLHPGHWGGPLLAWGCVVGV